MATKTKMTAHELAGNWEEFDCFVWFREVEDPHDWAIIYTHNRDSKLLDLSNASVIAKEMQPFAEGDDPDVVFESHSHWACGHVDGFSLRCLRNGEPTKAALKYLELRERLEEYLILDESDYSERVSEATFENLKSTMWSVKDEFVLPENWQDEIYSWLSNSVDYSGELEDVDDQGGYPSNESLRAACVALGYPPEED